MRVISFGPKEDKTRISKIRLAAAFNLFEEKKERGIAVENETAECIIFNPSISRDQPPEEGKLLQLAVKVITKRFSLVDFLH